MFQITDMLSTHNIGIDTEEEFRKKLPKLWVNNEFKDINAISEHSLKKLWDNKEDDVWSEYLDYDDDKWPYSYDQARRWKILDCRKLADDGSNKLIDYARLILAGVHMMAKNNHVIVCCHAGISRSPSIAIGILVEYNKMSFYDAWALVRTKVPISNPEPAHISALKKLFGVTLP